MPLQTTGPISLKQIADEFEDAAPHSLSEFYGLTNTLPASGIIDFDDFYGQSNGFVLAKTITSNILQYNLNTDLIANGWNSIDPVEATITINSGIYVYSNNTSIAGFTIGTLPAGSTITIINNGYIMGKGGNGATARSSRVAATTGGPALDISYPVSITNNSYIAGGGGGGGDAFSGTSAGSGGGGGAGGGAGGGSYNYTTGGAGGSIGSTGSNGQPVPAETFQNGNASGGGGGRILPGTGASGQTCTVPLNQPGEARAGGLGGGAGGSGGASCGGPQNAPKSSTGGAGGSAGNSGSTGGGPLGAAGGGGGGWGATGAAGTFSGTASGWSTTSGASGGKCVNLNGNTVTWVATGTRYGAIS